MIVISRSLSLTSPPAGDPLTTPIFGWKSVIISITGTSEAGGFPAANVLNPSTNLRWLAEPGSPPADQYLQASITSVEALDYLAVAVHNFGSGAIPVSVEGSTGGSPEWFELVEPRMLANNDPVIFRFTPQSLSGIRLRMQPGDETPSAAVMYAGKLLVSPRGTHQDYVPINLARMTTAPIGVSESGHFLGRVIISQSRTSTFALKLLKSDWYRANFDPFVRAAQDQPFFFAWKPVEFPNDIGFCFLSADPQPSRSFDTGRMSVSLQMTGVAV